MKAKKVATYGILIALAMVFSYLESLFPLTIAVPGVKMGLANTVTIFALYRLGLRDACFLSLIRVTLVAILYLQPGLQRSGGHRELGGDVPHEPVGQMQPGDGQHGRRRGPQRRSDHRGHFRHRRPPDRLVLPHPLPHRHRRRRRNRPGLRPDPPPDGALGILSPLFAARWKAGRAFPHYRGFFCFFDRLFTVLAPLPSFYPLAIPIELS